MPGGLGVVGSEGSVLEYQEGSDWKFLPGISSWSESGGDAPTRDIVAFEGVGSKVGRQRPQTIECEVAAYIPNHPGWKYIRAQAIAKKVVRFRLTSTEDIIYEQTAGKMINVPGIVAANASAIIVVSGTGDFDPASSSFAPGMELRIGGANYVIEYIDGINTNAAQESGLDSDSPWIVRERAGTANTAEVAATATFSIVVPALRRGPFAAEIVATDLGSLAAEGDLSSGLTLRPTSVLPEYAIV